MARSAAILGLVSLLALGGCASDPGSEESSPSLRSVRAEVVDAIKEVGAKLQQDGARVAQATGEYRSCGSSPTASLEYRGGGKLVGGAGSLAQRVREATTVLESAGWQRTGAGESPFPYANLEKGAVRVKLGPDPLRDSDAMSFGVSGECIRVSDEQAGKSYPRDTIEVPPS